jgi:ferredoxin like protein
MSINDKLIRTRFVVDSGTPHIKVNTAQCGGCKEKPCLVTCPVQCYTKETHGVAFSWENCVECGTCRIVCPHMAVTWNYPRGGYGVCFRYG